MKKVFAVMFAFILAVSFSVSSFAGNGASASGLSAKGGDVLTTDPSYVVEDVNTHRGATFDFYISVVNNPGIISLRNSVTYDSYAFELVSIENLGLFNGFTTPPADLSSPFTLRWADSLATENNTANGDIAKVTFRVKDNVLLGYYDISVAHTEARDCMGRKVTFLGAEAKVLVSGIALGDSDGDGEVTDWDSILLERYLAGWDIDLHLEALDVDKDGEITDWDSIVLSRYLAGWEVEGLPGETEEMIVQPDTVNFTVAKVFSKNMVVQRDEPLRIWGFADEESNGGIISVEFMGEKAQTIIKDGEWEVVFDKSFPACADTGNSIKVISKSMEVVLTDVLVGDVYMVIGQSNVAYDMSMHWAYCDSNDVERCGRNADYNLPIRINYNTLNSPNTTVKRGGDVEAKDITRSNSWRIANRSSITQFSAIGYMFARCIVLQTGGTVPVGMIEIDGNGQPLPAFLCNEIAEKHNTDAYSAANDCLMTNGTAVVPGRYLYNEFMAPFQRMPIAGILWYQGESDHPSNDANRYPQIYVDYIEYMRGTHNIVNKDFPVFFVEFPSMYTQPAGYDNSTYPWQYMDVGKIRGMMGSMVTMCDNLYQVQSGDFWSDQTFWNGLHPNCKYEQALRAAKIACAVKGEGGVTLDKASGPIVESVTYSEDGRTAIIKFTNVGDGLKTIDGSTTVKGFNSVTSSNNVGGTVTGTITSKDTVEVRLSSRYYGIAYNVKTGYYFGTDINLCNSEGIPAGAFMFKR